MIGGLSPGASVAAGRCVRRSPRPRRMGWVPATPARASPLLQRQGRLAHGQGSEDSSGRGSGGCWCSGLPARGPGSDREPEGAASPSRRGGQAVVARPCPWPPHVRGMACLRPGSSARWSPSDGGLGRDGRLLLVISPALGGWWCEARGLGFFLAPVAHATPIARSFGSPLNKQRLTNPTATNLLPYLVARLRPATSRRHCDAPAPCRGPWTPPGPQPAL